MLVIDNSFYYYYNTFEENIYNLEIAFFFFNFATKYIMDNCLNTFVIFAKGMFAIKQVHCECIYYNFPKDKL